VKTSKILALFLAALMVLAAGAFAVACDKEEPATTTTAAPATTGAPATTAAPAAEGDWNGYIEYLVGVALGNSPSPEADEAAIRAMTSWDDIQAALDAGTAPWDQFFSATALNLSTYEEWLAGDIRESAVTGAMAGPGPDAGGETTTTAGGPVHYDSIDLTGVPSPATDVTITPNGDGYLITFTDPMGNTHADIPVTVVDGVWTAEDIGDDGMVKAIQVAIGG
jgi:hypothetical protein